MPTAVSKITSVLFYLWNQCFMFLTTTVFLPNSQEKKVSSCRSSSVYRKSGKREERWELADLSLTLDDLGDTSVLSRFMDRRQCSEFSDGIP